MFFNKLILSLCLMLSLSSCYRQSASEEQVVVSAIQTLVFAYQIPQERSDLEAWFASKGLILETQMAGPSKAEYAVSLSDAQYQMLQSEWSGKYRFERRDQRLIVICCNK